MKQLNARGLFENSKVSESNHQCVLDLSLSSKLLSTKIQDIPQKDKYEIIIKPLFEYCFGTSDDSVWEKLNDDEEEYESDDNDHDEEEDERIDENNDQNDTSQIIYLKIDWNRDRTFIHGQIFNLVVGKFLILANKLGLWKNRSFVLTTTEYRDIKTLKYVDDNFRNDREIVMAAVNENGRTLKYASSELRNDFEIVKTAARNNRRALWYASKQLSSNKEIVMTAVKSNGLSLEYMPTQIRNDRKIVKIAIQENGNALGYASKELKSDKEIALLAIESSPKAYECASNQLTNDQDLILKVLSKSCDYIFGIDQSIKLFKNDRKFILAIAKLDGLKALRNASLELRDNREIVIEAVQQNPNALVYASSELRNDKEIVKMAVMENGSCLTFASNELKDDKEIAELAFKSSEIAVRYFSERLRNDIEFLSGFGKRGYLLKILPDHFMNDREIVLEAIKLDPQIILTLPNELKRDREFILQAVTRCGMALRGVSSEFQKDRELVLAAVTQNGNSINFASQEVWNDKEIVLKAAETCNQELLLKLPSFDKQIYLQLIKKRGGECLKYFPRKFQIDREILMEALKTHPKTAFLNASGTLKVMDRVFAMRVVKRDGMLLGEMCSKHKSDREIISCAVKQNIKALKYASID
ncbi:predicted protein [Naegleria gruberi]|uniref:Predicted protein n=1 Tax=Naegleria gruberi TaxID=5762 RepID=D2VLS1_NAEGR|nr:uncharacterized protein NAEGRDRAFT_50610 [Naegleria gruberi]EFC42104.1 predicted protein [Naegleria gruberi]|eukprot:XP_002674848.1 predicted protein [Naegleria gruberi strain NEG-M]